MHTPDSYEIAEYSKPELGVAESYKVIKQIVFELQRENPACAMWVDMAGDLLKIHHQAYVMFLPTRLKEIEANAAESFKKFIAHLKKEFKLRAGKDLKFSEQKDLTNYSVEKVSLNQRYMYRCWRFYKIGV